MHGYVGTRCPFPGRRRDPPTGGTDPSGAPPLCAPGHPRRTGWIAVARGHRWRATVRSAARRRPPATAPVLDVVGDDGGVVEDQPRRRVGGGHHGAGGVVAAHRRAVSAADEDRRYRVLASVAAGIRVAVEELDQLDLEAGLLERFADGG